MFKFILIGVWVSALTLGSSYAAMVWQSGQQSNEEKAEFFGGLDYVKIPPLSVPIIEKNEIQGYVLTELVFTIDGKKLKQMSVPPDPFLVHDAIRTIYGSKDIDFSRLEDSDIAAVAKTIKTSVNTRFKSELIADVLFQDIKFISVEQIRSGATR